MKSLEKQLSTSLGFSLVVIFGFFWWASMTAIHVLTEDYVVTRLEHDTETIIKHLQFKDNRWYLEQEISPIYSQLNSGHYFIVKTPHNSLTSKSLSKFNLQAQVINKGTDIYETAGPDNQTVLVLVTQLTKNQQPISVWVAEDHAPIQHSLFIFDIIFGLFSLLIMVTIFGLQRYWLKRGFNQLKPLETALCNLQDDYRLNININDYPSEISTLITNLNLAFNNATTQIEKSRHANVNLAHTLKTPLNLIYQLLDQPSLNTQTQQQLKQQAQTIYNLLERQLKKAHIAAGSMATRRFNAQHLQDLIHALQNLYPHIAWKVSFNDKQVRQLALDQEDGYELFGNLLDNACKWADHKVRLTLTTKTTGTIVSLEDDGPGVPLAELQKIQQRGYRLDETADGQGIGLSIVADLVTAYQVKMTFQQTQLNDTNALSGLHISLFFQR